MNSRTVTKRDRSKSGQVLRPHVKFEPNAQATQAKDPTGQTRKRGPKVLSAANVSKSYRKNNLVIPVLQDVNLDIHESELLAIVGQSGSGKSTLLHLLATLDQPDTGEITFAGQRLDLLSGAQRDAIRNRQLGMIFQFYHLLPELTMLENVLVPLMIAEGAMTYWWNKRTYVEEAKSLLDMVGLSHRIQHRPGELSGGEMQRVAIARALITKPQILLADEPTGNLDPETGQEILEILQSLNAERNLTIVMVTHDDSIALRADRKVRLKSGSVDNA